MKKLLISAAFMLATSNVNAKCVEPSEVINYLPEGITQEFCFESDLDKWTESQHIKIIYQDSSPRSLFLTPLSPGIFTNLIVFQKDGSRKEFNLLTLERVKVEKVELIKIEN